MERDFEHSGSVAGWTKEGIRGYSNVLRNRSRRSDRPIPAPAGNGREALNTCGAGRTLDSDNRSGIIRSDPWTPGAADARDGAGGRKLSGPGRTPGRQVTFATITRFGSTVGPGPIPSDRCWRSPITTW